MSDAQLATQDGSRWREGACGRAEKLLARATADAARAELESLPQRREVLLESARRLTQLAEAELRVSQPPQ